MTWATIDGALVGRVELYVPQYGVWYADVTLLDDTDVSGRVTLSLGEIDLSGTVDPSSSGTRGAQRFVRLVGGAGGWGTLLTPKHYASDNGVKAATVAGDAARAAGETLSGVSQGLSLGRAYVRTAGLAARVLDDAVGRTWWVDYDGVTQVGERSTSPAASGSYQVLEERPHERLVVLGMDDLRSVGIGTVLSEGLDEPFVVREMTILVEEDVRVTVWGGGAGAGRLESAVRASVEALRPRGLYGLFRYRVVRMSGERVELQAIRADLGLPDILPVDQYPGLAGAHAELTPGAEVLVAFVEGDRTLPIVAHFAGRRGPGHVPTKLRLALSGSGAGAARNGDAVEITIPMNTFLVSAQNGVANPTDLTFTGTITEGSDIVEVG